MTLSDVPGLAETVAGMGASIEERIKSIIDYECSICITELSMMGLDISWAYDLAQCFTIDVESNATNVSASVNLDVGQEFALISKIEQYNIQGQDVSLDQKQEGEDWMNDNGTNVQYSLNLIFANVKTRAQGSIAQVINDSKANILQTIGEYYVNNELKNTLTRGLALP